MTATETLKHEHRIILRVLDAAESEAQRIQAGGAVDAEKVETILDFVRNFADRCHHAKEEEVLFAKMAERGARGDQGPIAVMLREHGQGRARVAAVASALPLASVGDPVGTETVSSNLQGYVNLLRAHIDKEDNVLYPMADELLTPEDQQELVEAFERVEAEDIGTGVHEKYHALAHQLTGEGT